MSKQDPRQQPPASGWFTPHAPVDWDGMIPTGKILPGGEIEMVKEQSMTKQSFKDECDINVIMARYQKTGLLEHVRQGVPQYLDQPGFDYFEAQSFIAGANSLFQSLPADVRAQFENHPGIFLRWMEDPANAAKAREMGLMPPEATQEGSGYPPIDPAAKSAPARSTQRVEASSKAGDTPPSNKTPEGASKDA